MPYLTLDSLSQEILSRGLFMHHPHLKQIAPELPGCDGGQEPSEQLCKPLPLSLCAEPGTHLSEPPARKNPDTAKTEWEAKLL